MQTFTCVSEAEFLFIWGDIKKGVDDASGGVRVR